MREIKFRAWDTIDQKMTDGPFAIVNDPRNRDPEYWKPLPWIIVRPNGRQWVGSATSRYIPMQYTGLKDKNGKEIYEGDIIEDKNGCGKVVWCGVDAMWGVEKDEDWTYPFSCNVYEKTHEIIGNIYSNPELLK